MIERVRKREGGKIYGLREIAREREEDGIRGRERGDRNTV